MPVTAQDLIERSMRTLGLLAAGRSATSLERSDCLPILNELIESWNNENLIINEESREPYTLTANLNPHTIGPGGSFNTIRPLSIKAASITALGSTQEIPIQVLREAGEWQRIADKTVSATIPEALWYEAENPLGKVWLYPISSQAATLVLYLVKLLDAALTLTTNLSFPQGYLRALRFNLAREIASEFGVQISEQTLRIARESLTVIKERNLKVPILESDYPFSGARLTRANILTGR